MVATMVADWVGSSVGLLAAHLVVLLVVWSADQLVDS